MNSEMPMYLYEAIANLGTTDEELAALLECTVDDMYEELVGGSGELPTELVVKAYGVAGTQFIANCQLIRTAWANDVRRLQHLNTLFNIASDMSAMWDAENPHAPTVARSEMREGYFLSIADTFWEWAKYIKGEVWVEFPGNGNEEEDMRTYLNVHSAEDPKKGGPPKPCGWVIKVGGEYRLYEDEGVALQAAYDLTYAFTEEDIQWYFDELDPYTAEIGSAVDYLESKGLGKGRTGNREGITVLHTAAGLKEELGKDGWVNFLLSFGYGYTAHPAIPT